jgi:hypothetical protein
LTALASPGGIDEIGWFGSTARTIRDRPDGGAVAGVPGPGIAAGAGADAVGTGARVVGIGAGACNPGAGPTVVVVKAALTTRGGGIAVGAGTAAAEFRGDRPDVEVGTTGAGTRGLGLVGGRAVDCARRLGLVVGAGTARVRVGRGLAGLVVDPDEEGTPSTDSEGMVVDVGKSAGGADCAAQYEGPSPEISKATTSIDGQADRPIMLTPLRASSPRGTTYRPFRQFRLSGFIDKPGLSG